MSSTFYLEKNKNNFAEILGKYNYDFNTNDIVAGTIVGIEDTGSIVDIGVNTTAYIPLSEISIKPISHPSEVFDLGEIREFVILSSDLLSKRVIISIKKLEYLRAWEKVKQLNNESATIYNAQFDKYNKGGMQINLEGLKGFIPNSHLPKRFSKINLSSLYVPIRFLEADQKSNNLLLSARSVFLHNQMSSLTVGETIQGCVVDIKPFGLLINIFGITSLLHISEISFKRVKDLNKLFEIGQSLDVVIIYIDFKKQRVSLSTKNL